MKEVWSGTKRPHLLVMHHLQDPQTTAVTTTTSMVTASTLMLLPIVAREAWYKGGACFACHRVEGGSKDTLLTLAADRLLPRLVCLEQSSPSTR